MRDAARWACVLVGALVMVRLVDGTPMRVILRWACVIGAALLTGLGLSLLLSTLATPPPAGYTSFGWLLGLIFLLLGVMGLTAGIRNVAGARRCPRADRT